MTEIIEYIIGFLLGDTAPPKLAAKVGYTSNPKEYRKYKLVIKPSDFFNEDIYGTADSLP